MAHRAIREYDAKKLLERYLGQYSGGKLAYVSRSVLVTADADLDGLAAAHPWLRGWRLVVKPDQLFGKRGKNNLVLVGADLDEAKAWIATHMGKEVTVHREFDAKGEPLDAGVTGTLTHFIVEPLIPHASDQEYYLAFTGHRHGDTVLFSQAGGVDVESAREGLISIDVPWGPTQTPSTSGRF